MGRAVSRSVAFSLSVDKVSLFKFSLLNSVCVCKFKHLEKLSAFSASAGFMGYVCVMCVLKV